MPAATECTVGYFISLQFNEVNMFSFFISRFLEFFVLFFIYIVFIVFIHCTCLTCTSLQTEAKNVTTMAAASGAPKHVLRTVEVLTHNALSYLCVLGPTHTTLLCRSSG
jgi:hypothetical protein